MLEKIQKAIFEKYKKEDQFGLFLSAFDKEGKLLISNGVVQSDKSLSDLLELLYHGLVEKINTVSTIVVDIVTSFQQETDMSKIGNLSCKDYGICLAAADGTKSGTILPNTLGVPDIKTALTLVKQKYSLSGGVNIYIFQTQRFVISG